MPHMQEEGTTSFHGRYGTSRLPRQLDASSETRMTDPNYYILPLHDLHTGDVNPYYPTKACLECAQSNSPFYYKDYIYWPNRTPIIDQQIQRILQVTRF